MANARRDPVEPDSPPPGSIEELFASLESPLLRYALRLTGTRSPAEDVVQEAFMKLHAQFDEVREPRRWLYRTVHNLALNQRRAASKIIPLDPAPVGETQNSRETIDPLPLPDEQIARLEGIGQVRLSLNALDARSREVVDLKFHEELSYKEISQRTGLKVGHVGYLLHYALKTLAAELAKTGGVK
jgi:RNA polymerase sigma-70 factor (ECF subfamily)